MAVKEIPNHGWEIVPVSGGLFLVLPFIFSRFRLYCRARIVRAVGIDHSFPFTLQV